jgi:hypothetical protein
LHNTGDYCKYYTSNMRILEINLYAVAEEQLGYFTTKQAIAAGYTARTHHYHVGTGAWIREYRGIYRLAGFPASPEGQYVLWSLWSRNRNDIPQGVFSLQTALCINELSDVMPVKLHMTVPPGFRRNSAIPEILNLHVANIPDIDIEQRQGYRVVRPLRTIIDLLENETETLDHLRQALKQALARGLITKTEIKTHPKRKAIESLLIGTKP